MRKKILKIVFAVILIGLMIGTIVFININNKKKSNATGDGSITVIINDLDNNMVSKKRIDYKKGNTLYNLINDNYKLNTKSSVYGHYILGISDDSFSIDTKGDSSGWLWIEIGILKEDREYNENIDIDDYDIKDSDTGIDSIEIVPDMLFVINHRDNTHNTSILRTSMDYHETNNKIIEIILYVVLSVFFVGIICYIIFTRKKEQITVRQLCILSFMTVLLFVQEELLTFIPNIQLTFLLIAVYTCVFKLKYTFMCIFVHVILDNMIMGSLTPVVFIPMLIGYMIYASLIYIVRNKNLFFITLFGVIGSLIYCYLFLLVNVTFLDVNFMAYFIADIPFEILLVLSTIFTILYLYKPLTKILDNLWNN